MKWLEGNPLGLALVAVSGVLALMVLVMSIVWNFPVSTDMTETESEKNIASSDSALANHQIGNLGDYRVINEKPVFNESRLPVMVEGDGDMQGDDLLNGSEIQIKGAPDVRLTGIIITPSMKIASLTPANANLESVTAHEGESLTGEFLGWQVSTVNPRTVVLESRDGQSLELELLVHDAKITEPPKPAPVAKSSLDPSEVIAKDEDEPLSRAEQIRQRIAERREELRREQEEQDGAPANTPRPASNPNAYRDAIRAQIKNNRKDQGSHDKEDG